MDNMLMQKDYVAAQKLYYKVLKNKKLFLELLDNISDLATFIPVCMAEYGQCFDLFNIDELINDINSVLNDYSLHIAHL